MHRMKLGWIVLFIGTVATAPFALDRNALDEADRLYEDDRPLDAIRALEAVLPTAGGGPDRAEVLWRLARATLAVGESQEDAGEDPRIVLATYERGEGFAVQSVAADPANHLGYYWQSA